MKATREALEAFLLGPALPNSVVVLSADLKKPTKVDKFALRYPTRYIECGIAECNMIGISAGLAQAGFSPICTSFASFLTGKYDTIRVSIAYQQAPVLLVGTHAGLAIGKDGVTQMGLEDLSLMLGMPNMRVINPSTHNLAQCLLSNIFCHGKLEVPTYLRLGRQPVTEHYNENIDCTHGFNTFGSGQDLIIISSGCVLDSALEAQHTLLKYAINSTVIDIFDLTHYNAKLLLDHLSTSASFCCIEDHSIIGGCSSVIQNLIIDNHLPINSFHKLGIHRDFPESGEPKELYSKYRINATSIVELVLNTSLD